MRWSRDSPWETSKDCMAINNIANCDVAIWRLCRVWIQFTKQCQEAKRKGGHALDMEIHAQSACCQSVDGSSMLSQSAQFSSVIEFGWRNMLPNRFWCTNHNLAALVRFWQKYYCEVRASELPFSNPQWAGGSTGSLQLSSFEWDFKQRKSSMGQTKDVSCDQFVEPLNKVTFDCRRELSWKEVFAEKTKAWSLIASLRMLTNLKTITGYSCTRAIVILGSWWIWDEEQNPSHSRSLTLYLCPSFFFVYFFLLSSKLPCRKCP